MQGKLLLPEHYGARTPSPRQLRVIELVAQGFKNCEIAGKLGIGSHVVRNHLSKIYDKIGVNNRVELALWYEARIHERAEIERTQNKKTKAVDKAANLSSWQGTLSA